MRWREVERRDNGKWKGKITKTLGGDTGQRLWVNSVWVNALSDSHRPAQKLKATNQP